MKLIKSKKIKKKYRIKKNIKPFVLEQVSNNQQYFASSESKKNAISLAYLNKKNETSILYDTPNVQLVDISSYGQIELHNKSNMLIQGENLSVLKSLLNDRTVAGKIKLIYIDPPFSTQQEFRVGKDRTATMSPSKNDTLAYSDNLIGAEYIEFLRERLILLKELLDDDGSIYLHIDYKIGHYVKILMDEIFGVNNFINDITRIKCNPKNFSRMGYGNIKDMILFYSKGKNCVWNEPRVEMTEEDIARLFHKIDKNGRRYTTNPLHAPGETKNGATGEKWNGLLPPSGRHWRVPPKELSRLEKLGLIEWSKNGNPRKKIFADEIFARGKKLQDVWELKDPPYPLYPTEKNIEMLKRIIQASSNAGDLVLDCFAGSGTTLLAAEQLKRNWIGIDNSKSAIEIIVKRLKGTQNINTFTTYKTEEKTNFEYTKTRKAK